MNRNQVSKKYEAQRKKLAAWGYICSGSLMSLYRKCGKTNCACYKDRKAHHGPYYVWTRKIDGKTITRTLSPAQAESCREYMQNLMRMELIIVEMKDLSAQAIEQMPA